MKISLIFLVFRYFFPEIFLAIILSFSLNFWILSQFFFFKKKNTPAFWKWGGVDMAGKWKGSSFQKEIWWEQSDLEMRYGTKRTKRWWEFVPPIPLMKLEGRKLWAICLRGVETQRAILRLLLGYTSWLFGDPKKPSLRTRIWYFIVKHCYVRTYAISLCSHCWSKILL